MGQEGRVQIPIVHSSLALKKHVNLPALCSSCVKGRYGHCTWGLGSVSVPGTLTSSAESLICYPRRV